MTTNYQPPKQTGIGQFFDSALILVLLAGALWMPKLLKLPGAGKVTTDFGENPTWEALGQNATMQAQWEKLGMDAKAASGIISSRFDYTISETALIITAALLFAYYIFILRVSETQYRQVIKEKFPTR